ncbi:efflux RND transporter periplasmic adaptor subunit [Paenibacillus humicola]|uniref:efflux RND transporter periplasmic adaptor subunit n=1 Tax=Paenibacillus humicola TaxID=3110540 RepID=UPI00237ADB6C|nr:efflux RND transporter periplasmic adaptor subunit [Paenibacillus humicola]
MFMKWLTGSSFKRSSAVLLGASLVFASGCSLLPKEQSEETLPEITPPQISKKPEYDVTTTTLETKVTAAGNIISMQEETMYFTIDEKRIKQLDVKTGQKVTAGQVIASLDMDDEEKALRDAKIQFQQDELDMKQTLRNRDTMNPVEFQQKQIAFEEKRQALADQQEELDKATLKAPFAGTVVSVSVQKGDQVKAYDPICIIADTSQLTAAAKMTPDDLQGVAVGMPAVVDINNIGQVTGKVKQLPVFQDDDQNGNGTGNGGQQRPDRPEDYLIVQLDKKPPGMTRGTPLSISIITQRKENAIVIPPSALRTMGARTYVQVAEKDGTKREVDVEVGQQTATEVEIVKGLTPGQKVVGR